MDTLFRLKDTFVQFLSPAAKRRRTVGPGTASTSKDHEYLAPSSEPRGIKAQAAAHDHLNQKYLSTPQPKNPRKRARVDDEDEIVISPGDSVSQKSIQIDESEGDPLSSPLSSEGSGDVELEDVSEREITDEDEHMREEEEIYSEEEDAVDVEAQQAAAAEQKVQEYLARQAELALRKEDVEKAKASGDWHPEALFLYERLALRSFEPLLPVDWQIDFPTLPEILFTHDDENTFVNSNCLPGSRGIKALQALINLGVRVRDNLSVGGYPEKMVAKEIQKYIKWSEMDGGYTKMRFIPVLTVVAARSSQSAGSIGAAISSQMKFLGERHRENLAMPGEHINELGELEVYSKPPPLLYGLIVAQTKVVLVTSNSADSEGTVKHLAHVDFKNKDMDVWNGFAIAFMVIAARNYMMSIKDELEIDRESSPDVDA